MSNGQAAVIGLGNPLMGDDGFGLAVLDELREHWELGPDVELMDGGTWGMSLLPAIEDADSVILIDAIDQGWPEGSPVELEREDLPRLFSHKLSPHQVDIRETLAAAELRDHLPRRLVAIGIQPAHIGLGTDLSDCARARVGMVAALVVARLHRWGHASRRRPAAA